MNVGEVWLKRRQRPERERFFVMKKNNNSGFRGLMMARQSLYENVFLSNDSIKGFEEKNKLLTDDEVAKYILLGDLNPAIL